MGRKMLLRILSGALVLVFSRPVSGQNRTVYFPITEQDSIHYELQLVFDAQGSPSHFYRDIFTPVCFTGECKPVYINFYWDLLGNYVRYDLPEREVLTKMDHDEFTGEDYLKLQEILANPSSMLGEVAIEDLVSTGTDNLADSVDAKTGATLKTIKREVIEGAVYTCYTLWHIAYGKVAVEAMRHITDSLQTPGLLHRFLRSGNHHYQYWALDRVLDREGKADPSFQGDLQLVISGDNIFLSRSLLQRLHPDFFSAEETQLWLLKLYRERSYAMQLAILKRLASIRPQPATLKMLAGMIPSGNREQAEAMAEVFKNSPGLVGADVSRTLSEIMLRTDRQRSQVIYDLLQSLASRDKTVQKNLKTYARQEAQP